MSFIGNSASPLMQRMISLRQSRGICFGLFSCFESEMARLVLVGQVAVPLARGVCCYPRTFNLIATAISSMIEDDGGSCLRR